MTSDVQGAASHPPYPNHVRVTSNTLAAAEVHLGVPPLHAVHIDVNTASLTSEVKYPSRNGVGWTSDTPMDAAS